jgi:hypothetical protein
MTPGLEMPGLPDFPELNHWHAWVDTILGVETELRTPFVDGARITEAALLAVKAARFPGQELHHPVAEICRPASTLAQPGPANRSTTTKRQPARWPRG